MQKLILANVAFVALMVFGGGQAAMSQLIYSNDFEDDPVGTYTASNLNTDWNSPPFSNGVDEGRVSIVSDASGKFLEVLYPEGLFGSGDDDTGAQWKLEFGQGYEAVEFEYRVKFGVGFDFVRGGKLPGLIGGEGNVGGNVPDGTDGFSARMMWRTDGSSGSNLTPDKANIVQYVYHPDQPGTFGEDFRWDDGPLTDWKEFESDRWYHLRHRVVMNTPGQNDGIIMAWLDGELVLNVNNIRFRDVASLQIDQMYFSTFFGGGSSIWATTKDEYAYFDDFQITVFDPVGPNSLTIFDDSFADGNRAETNTGGENDTNWWTSSSSSGDEINIGPPNTLGLVTGSSGRGLHTVFPTQTLASVGDKLTATYTFTTPATVASSGGSGSFRVGLFDTLGRAALDADVSASSGSPNAIYGWAASNGGPGDPGLPGYMFDMDVNTGSSADLNFRTHNVGSATGRLMATTGSGSFSSFSSGPDEGYTFDPNTTYTGSFSVERISSTELRLTGTLDGASYSLTDTTFTSTSFGFLGFHINSNQFGSSNTAGDPDNGIDFSNINVVFTSAVVLGDANDDGEFNNVDIAAFVLALTDSKLYALMYPNVDPDVVLDMNGDGMFDNSDIAAFVAALTGP